MYVNSSKTCFIDHNISSYTMRCSSPKMQQKASTGGGKDKPEAGRWSEEEEERLLRTALQISREAVESFDATVSPVERVRRAVGGDFTPKEIVQKTKKLRRRYEEMCRRRGEADADVFAAAAFEISDQIWGFNGGDKEKEKEGERNAA